MLDLERGRRVFPTLTPVAEGIELRACYDTPKRGPYAVAMTATGMLEAKPVRLLLATPPAARTIATVEVTERATVAIAVGLRTLSVQVAGVRPGVPILAVPVTDLPAGYAVHNAWASSAGWVRLRITGPALALGAETKLTLAIVRSD